MQTVTGPGRLVALFIVILVAGCATDPTIAPSEQPGEERESAVLDANADIQALLARAGKTTPPRSIELTLDAAEQAIGAGSFDQAAAILERVDASYSRTLHRRALYLKAELEVGRGNPTAALLLLERPENTVGHIDSRRPDSHRSYSGSRLFHGS
ncbi:MAG: hypothetical protein U5O39_19520 [Gammaproteobacteria bacterium]|nr:hypothetical protein [Gammaproteobacteria bacterium]